MRGATEGTFHRKRVIDMQMMDMGILIGGGTCMTHGWKTSFMCWRRMAEMTSRSSAATSAAAFTCTKWLLLLAAVVIIWPPFKALPLGVAAAAATAAAAAAATAGTFLRPTVLLLSLIWPAAVTPPTAPGANAAAFTDTETASSASSSCCHYTNKCRSHHVLPLAQTITLLHGRKTRFTNQYSGWIRTCIYCLLITSFFNPIRDLQFQLTVTINNSWMRLLPQVLVPINKAKLQSTGPHPRHPIEPNIRAAHSTSRSLTARSKTWPDHSLIGLKAGDIINWVPDGFKKKKKPKNKNKT